MPTRKSAKHPRKESLGNRIAFFRNQAGYSQRSLAKALGMSQRMIAHYESQGGRIPADLIVRLTQVLGLSADELLGSGQRRPKPVCHTRRFRKRIQHLEAMSRRDRDVVFNLIDAIHQTQQRKEAHAKKSEKHNKE